MAFWRYVALGAAGLYANSKINKLTKSVEAIQSSCERHWGEGEECAEYEDDSEELEEEVYWEQPKYKKSAEQLHTIRDERERKQRVEFERKRMYCFIDNEIKYEDFEALAQTAARRTKRVRSVSVQGARVFATVESQSKLTDWNFEVDFNNWGHVTGRYWMDSENNDSAIPEYYANTLSSLIKTFLSNHNVLPEDFASAVDANGLLGTPRAFNSKYKERPLQRLFKKGYHTIYMEHSSIYYSGEHLYVVLSLFKRYGFVNIRCEQIADVDDESNYYIYEVENVYIAEATSFEYGYAFPHNAQVVIRYHSKRKITMPLSASKLKKKNYLEVSDYLYQLGFRQVFARKIPDIVLGIVTKEGAVEDVLVSAGKEESISQGNSYFYDTNLIITYHTRKSR